MANGNVAFQQAVKGTAIPIGVIAVVTVFTLVEISVSTVGDFYSAISRTIVAILIVAIIALFTGIQIAVSADWFGFGFTGTGTAVAILIVAIIALFTGIQDAVTALAGIATIILIN